MNMITTTASALAAAAPTAAALAEQPLVSRPNMASTDNPIIAAIEKHRAAYAAHGQRCHELSTYQKSHRRPDGGLPKDRKSAKLERLLDMACDADADAADALLETEPRSVAGAVALLRYANEIGDDLLQNYGTTETPGYVRLIASVLKGLDRAA
jgi:hypothetical protein